MGITLTDVLLFGKAQSDDVDNATLVIYRRNILRWSALGGYLDVIVKGVSPLSLPDAIADSLAYVKAFGGTEQQTETIIQTATAQGKTEQRNLPDNYIERQFIYMMDGSYLLTDLIPTYDCKIEMDFQTTSIPAGNETFIGGRSSSAAGIGLLFAKIGSDVVVDAFGTGSSDRYTSSVTATANTRYKFTFDNKVATLESGGSTLFTNTFTGTEANGAALAINATNSNGTITGNTAGIYLYSFKAWNGQGELVANYIPAVQKGTVPVVGFYDTVSETFKTATSGTFAAGAEAVPTPDAPMDIVCNNGVLKAKHQSGLPLGYTKVEYIKTDSQAYIDADIVFNSGDIKFEGNIYFEELESVECDFIGNYSNQTGFCAGIYQQNKLFLYAPSANFSITATTGVWYNVIGEFENSIMSLTVDNTLIGSGSRTNFYKTNKIYLFRGGPAYQPLSSKQRLGIVKIWKDSVLVRNFVPCKNASNVVGMFDTVSQTFFTNAGTGDFTAGSTVSDPVEIYTVGTQETVTDNLGNVATCENLLQVDTYTDTQEILTGAVTRNIGIKVIDGTENWTYYPTQNMCYINTNLGMTTDYQNASCLSTHFKAVSYATGSPANGPDLVCFPSMTLFGIVCFRNLAFTTAQQFKDYFAQQYAAGTPVILLFQKETSTTETVTGQNLRKEPLTIAGSLPNLLVNTTTTDAVPTPEYPLDIVCNNGVLKTTAPLPQSYTALEYIESTETQYIDTGYKPDINGYKTKLKIRNTDSGTRWTGVIGSFGTTVSSSCKFGFDNNDKFTITAGSDIRSDVVVTTNTDYVIEVSIISGNISLKVDGTTILTSTNTFAVPTNLNLWLFSYNRNGYVYPGESFAGRIYYTEIYDSNDTLVRNFIPAKRNSDSVIGMYDTVSQTFFTNAGTGTFIAGAELPFIYTDGTVETIGLFGGNLYDSNTPTITAYVEQNTGKLKQGTVHTAVVVSIQPNTMYKLSGIQNATWWGTFTDSTIGTTATHCMAGNGTLTSGASDQYLICLLKATGTQYDYTDTLVVQTPQTATAEMLLKAGTYTDEQEVISGGVTRKVGVKVLDGTENWILSGGVGVWANFQSITGVAFDTSSMICSHSVYAGSGINIVNMNQNQFSSYTNGNIAFKNANTTSTSDWATFLANQYAAGTPVIVVYPLATETTETVTGQTLQVTDGDNVLEITQASLSGLELEAQYQAAVSLTIQEVQDANLDPNVEVTII